jgi:hypothetical protein
MLQVDEAYWIKYVNICYQQGWTDLWMNEGINEWMNVVCEAYQSITQYIWRRITSIIINTNQKYMSSWVMVLKQFVERKWMRGLFIVEIKVHRIIG